MDIDKLKDLMGRVTPGPWGFDDQGGFPDAYRVYAEGHVMLWMDHYHEGDHSSNATIIAMTPDLASEVIRLTAEHAQLVAANQALVKRDAEARMLIEDAELCGGDIDRPAARAFLAGEGK